MGVKGIVKRVANSAGNKVAKLSSLSSDQVQEIQDKREKYLLEMPNPQDNNAIIMTQRMLASSSVEIFNAYLPQIKDIYIPVESNAEYDIDFMPKENIRYFNITKWVTDKKENSIEKLVNVYAVLSNEDCNIALVFDRKSNETNVYMAVVNLENSHAKTKVDIYKNRIIQAIKGNFPGSEIKDSSNEDELFGMGILPCFNYSKQYSVATASNIPTEKSEKFISQTIEKLLDGIIPSEGHPEEEYTLVLLATPINDVEDRKFRLSELHSGLTPYASWSTTYTYNTNDSQSSSATIGINVGTSAGIQNGQNYSNTDTSSQTENSSTTDTQNQSSTSTKGETDSTSYSLGHTEGTSESHTEGKTDTLGGAVTIGSNQTVTGMAAPFGVGGSASVGLSESVSASYSHAKSVSDTVGKSLSDTITKGTSKAISKTMAQTTGTAIASTLGRAAQTAKAVTKGASKGTNFGVNFGANFARTSTVTAMVGKSEGITQNFANYNIQHALELLENQMKRLEQSTALGMWDFAAYVLSEDQHVANNVAHTYLALTLGEESYMAKSAVNLWRGKVPEERELAKEICKYIKELRHPIFALNPDALEEDLAYNVYPPVVTATTSLSGKELAYSLNFPQKSITGLPILECAEFGRNIVKYDEFNDNARKINMGKIFHMNHVENTNVKLDLDSLSSHVFITGSTGSGKSNTVYQIINESINKDVKILVIEPAKGEYKKIYGNDNGFEVYGTNPNMSKLLRINPFSFPKDIHVLEHLDRLVEIFNACWPMYAAMPAVLKNAIEKAYVECGWDLIESCNKYGEDLYPTFVDVARNIKEVINTSEYDDENKGAYKGSLLTRLNSLTTGINGLIFSSDEISSKSLFDDNVIVDLSRVGSSETKALIMGMLVLKMQEYRMISETEMNIKLKHLTVLEEAHNLLRRTSSEQSLDSSNLQGKSVEMLSNAIAEMRTYGEGFIIADQAPGLMDMSVIRNTNTKIIMRLPDQSDRELVGRAANLNDDQILEVSKLPCGVSVIYQNEWIQPILCKVNKVSNESKTYVYNSNEISRENSKLENIESNILDCIMDNNLLKNDKKEYFKKIRKKVVESRLNTKVKCDFLDIIELENSEEYIEKMRIFIYEFLSAEEAIKETRKFNDVREFIHEVVRNLKPDITMYSKHQIDLTMAIILYEHVTRDVIYKDTWSEFTSIYEKEGGVY